MMALPLASKISKIGPLARLSPLPDYATPPPVRFNAPPGPSCPGGGTLGFVRGRRGGELLPRIPRPPFFAWAEVAVRRS